MVVDRAEDAREFSPALTLHDGAEQHQRTAEVQHRRSFFEHCQRNTEEYDPPGDLFKKGVEEFFPLALFDQADGHARDDLHKAQRHRTDQDHRQIVERIKELGQCKDRSGADDGDKLREKVTEKAARHCTHDEGAETAEPQQAEQLSARPLGPVLFADDDRGDHHQETVPHVRHHNAVEQNEKRRHQRVWVKRAVGRERIHLRHHVERARQLVVSELHGNLRIFVLRRLARFDRTGKRFKRFFKRCAAIGRQPAFEQEYLVCFDESAFRLLAPQ